MTGALAEADGRLEALSNRAANTVERARIACLHVDVCVNLIQSDRAIQIALNYLRLVNIDWSPHPTDEDARCEYDVMRARLGGHEIEDAIDLPLMIAPEPLATVEVLTRLVTPAVGTDPNLLCLTICRATSLSLEFGNCDASCVAYVTLARFVGPHFGDYDAGFRFGRLGYNLVERRGFKRSLPSAYVCFSLFTLQWTSHVRGCRDLLRRAFEAASEGGDLTFASYCGCLGNSALILEGEPLSELLHEAESSLKFAQKIQFSIVSDFIVVQLALIRMLRGSTPKFGCLDGDGFEEVQFEQHVTSHPVLAIAACWYFIRKLQARCLAGSYLEALEASSMAQGLLWTSGGCLELAEYHFYSALAHAALCDSPETEQRGLHTDAMDSHRRQLRRWAKHCPENFENRTALLDAEIARIEGRNDDAMSLYERAKRSARENGFVQNEALAHEVAARFYSARGFDAFAEAYLRKARDGYLRWGADGKVRELERLYPYLASPEPRDAAALAGSPIQHLDVASVLKASQAVSSEIELPKLVEQLMTIALKNAGADRGVLILPHESDYRIEAEAHTEGEGVALQFGGSGDTTVPEMIIHYVMRTHERVILDDAAKPNQFSEDPHMGRLRPRSVLCVPLVRQGKLSGLLYLENTLTSHAFTPARIAVLEHLAVQAAISLENARLYSDLELQVGLLQLLPVSAWTLKPDGMPDFVNDVWLELTGQTRDFVRSHPEAWMAAVHPEDRDTASRSFWDGVRSGRGFVSETRLLRARDQVYRWHLNQAVVLHDAEGRVLKFVGTTTDIDDQKRAEEALRQAQGDLARANRITTMGELAASLAHEIKQPITGAITNANVCLRKLGRDEPNVDEVRAAVTRIGRDVQRAAEIIDKIRGQFEKGTPTKLTLNVNEMIPETIALLRDEAVRNGILIRTTLAADLPQIVGDRLQLQQVMMNLILNSIEATKDVDGTREIVVQSQQAEDGQILVSIRDTGTGLSPQIVEQIFNPFFTTKPHGTGMGLRISRSIVESHGGRLSAVGSTGRGATFHLNLPAAISTSI